MDHYEFIDAKPDGLKERVLGSTIFLYNKLSADETNAIRSKLNEIVDAVNFIDAPIFPLFALKFKGDGNTDPLALEVGDIVHGFYSAGVIWDNAIYNGGDPTDKLNYTRLADDKPDPVAFVAVSTGAGQVFELPEGFTAGSVLKSRGELYKGTEWTQSGLDLTIIVNVSTGNTIYVKPA
jgi:hypothetical protein